MEEWKWVKGYEGYYQVSDAGRVRSVDREVVSPHGVRVCRGRMLKMQLDTKGYLRVTLSKYCVQTPFAVHHLVARAFIGEPPGKVGCRRGDFGCDHLDMVRTNNASSNLEWVVHYENKRRSCKIDEKTLDKIFDLSYDGLSTREIGRELGVSSSYVSQILIGKRRSYAAASKQNPKEDHDSLR